MSTLLNANAPASFEIKSANLPLVALLLKTADLDQLAQELQQRFGDMPDFFDNDPLVVDLSTLSADAAAQWSTPMEFRVLSQLLRSYRLVPMAVRGGNEAQMAAALEAGLISAQDALIQRSAQRASDSQAQPAAPAAAVPAQAPAPAVPLPSPGAMVIDKPLRSGQQVYARGRDLIVMAMVNPGSEVIADGHIHVYAPLRGKAIAGARGNSDARIFALSMAPELISIAGIYRTSEKPLPDAVQGKAAQVRLAPGPDGDEKLVIDAIGV